MADPSASPPASAAPRPAPASADVVVVGSGLLGALVAHECAKAGASVLLLDSGPRIERSDVVARYRALPPANKAGSDFQGPYPSAARAPHPQYWPANDYVAVSGPDASAYTQGYLRVVGGTTWHWAASCWRHLPVDFRMRSAYGVGRDWPISYADLEPFYCRAEEEIGVAGPADPALQSPSERSRPYPMEAVKLGPADRTFTRVVNAAGYLNVPTPQGRNTREFDGRAQCQGSNSCMPVCPFSAMYSGIVHVEKAEAAGARVVENTVAYRVETDAANRRVTAVHCHARDGASVRVAGKAFVLACNGIETPRLLLLSADEKNPRGVANGSDQVGRNMMDHPGLHAHFLAREPMWTGNGPVQQTSIVDVRDGPWRTERAAIKILLNNSSQIAAAGRKALSMGLVGRALDREIRRRAACTVDLSVSHDMLPDPANRLTLSPTRRDGLGLPCPDIRYDVGDYVRRGAVETRKHLERIAALFGGEEVAITTRFNANNHVMGGTIMGADGRDSVVDGECRSHDHGNLFLATGGAMASAGTVNTTLTMAALALRAAQAVKRALN